MLTRKQMNNAWGCLLVWALFLAIFGLAIHDAKAQEDKDNTSLEYLQHLYEDYNLNYFSNKLPPKIKIGFDEHDEDASGSTICDSAGEHCDIEFNLKYTLAPRYAALILQHEMCHVEVWKTDGPDHGPRWQACMLKLDMQGSNRLVLIDGWYGH